MAISAELHARIQDYIDKHIRKDDGNCNPIQIRKISPLPKNSAYTVVTGFASPKSTPRNTKLFNILQRIKQEDFNESVMRIIRKKKLSDVDIYKKAGVSRSTFSKLRTGKDYHPDRTTAITICLALELPFDEMNKLLNKAGYAISDCSYDDLIISYYVQEEKNYNPQAINEALDDFGFKTLEDK